LFIRNVFGSGWSPDGTRVVYAGNGKPGALYVADASGKHRKLLLEGKRVHGNLADVAWSPDGSKIAFDAGSPGHIYVIRPDGTGLRQITHGHEDGGPVWSPDGKSMAFDRLDGNSLVIYMMRSSGGDQRAVTAGAEPVWSPDGRLLAFESVDDSPPRILTVRPTGRNRRVVAHGLNPAWTPDGRLSFICCVKGYNDGELTDAYALDVRGGSRVRLVSNLDGNATLDWHR
jgi:Tol biopolymer transport system component